MPEAKRDTTAVYDALRCDLIHLLMEHRSQGRFTRAAEGTGQAIFLAELTRSIADILLTAYSKADTNAHAAALADARAMAGSIIDDGVRAARIPTASDVDNPDRQKIFPATAPE